MHRPKNRPPTGAQVKKPATQPWLEPPIELATTDVISVPPDASSDHSSPHMATPSWSNLELLSPAKVLAPPRLPEFDGATNGTKVTAWSQVSARVTAVATARTTFVVTVAQLPEPPAARVAPVSPAPSVLDVDTAGEFDRNAAMQGLRQAGDASRTCLAGGGASGSARVAVTFARSGAVSDVVVEPPLAG